MPYRHETLIEGLMKRFALKACTVAGLTVLASSSWAQSWGLGASQRFTYDTNLFGNVDGEEQDDVISSTGVNGLLNLELGRQQLQGTGAFSLNRYDKHSELNGNGHDLGLRLNWETIGSLSGTLGARTIASQYEYGIDSEGPSRGKNIATTDEAFFRAQLGGSSAWVFNTGLNAQRRRYSASDFQKNELDQWTGDVGATYRFSPDLSAHLTLRHTKTDRPDYTTVEGDFVGNDVTRNDLELGTTVQITGASGIDARVALTRERYKTTADNDLVTGYVAWRWRPTGKLGFVTTLARDTGTGSGIRYVPSDDDTGEDVPTSTLTSSTQLRNTLGVKGTWNATAKIDVNAGMQWARREVSSTFSDSSSTTRDQTYGLNLGVSYEPLRYLSTGCQVSYQKRTTESDAANSVTRPYQSTVTSCFAQLWFN